MRVTLFTNRLGTALLENDLVKKMCADLILILLDSSRQRGSNDVTHVACTDSTKNHSRNIPSGALTSQFLMIVLMKVA